MARRVIDGIMAVLFAVTAVMTADMAGIWGVSVAAPITVMLFLCAALHFVWAFKPDRHQDCGRGSSAAWSVPAAVPTELILLGEDGTKAAAWNIYGKNGVVIGRDVGENQVTVDLNDTAYASMIDIEHAVLNYSGDCWYIEDVSEKNGISIEKADGRKYKIAYGKPCRLERGDIIHIALTRLQII